MGFAAEIAHLMVFCLCVKGRVTLVYAQDWLGQAGARVDASSLKGSAFRICLHRHRDFEIVAALFVPSSLVVEAPNWSRAFRLPIAESASPQRATPCSRDRFAGQVNFSEFLEQA